MKLWHVVVVFIIFCIIKSNNKDIFSSMFGSKKIDDTDAEKTKDK